MKNSFDHAAASYDRDFTTTKIGESQRGQVWNYLNKALPDNKSLKILELNSGTGEDALRFAKKGHDVLATDLSESMIEVAKRKLDPHDALKLNFEKLDIRNIGDVKEKYDLIFSNFGGFNCLCPNELNKFLNKTSSVLKPKGRLIIVLMPRFCFVESLYFIVSFQFKKVFRRMRKGPIMAAVDQANIPIYYYSPKSIRNILKATLIGQVGIGFFVPPSYLEGKMSNSIIALFHKIDVFFQRFKFPSIMSDHYLIDFSFDS